METKKAYDIVIYMDAAMHYSVTADSPDEALDKAWEFIDSDDFFRRYREECDFFAPYPGPVMKI